MLKKIVLKEKDVFQISLKLIFKNKQGQILGLKGLTGGVYEGYYDLPGGRIDTDEFRKPFAKIIDREIKEELGKKVKYKLSLRPLALGWHQTKPKIDSTGKKKRTRVMYIGFEAQYLSGQIKISAEHEGMAWFEAKEKVIAKNFLSGNLELLKAYLKLN